MKEINYSELNPGVRKLVKLLRDNGFDTRDSGDGNTREYECDLDIPYVHIVVQPEDLWSKALDVRDLLNEHGVTFHPLDELMSMPTIEASWNTQNDNAFISLFNVTDDMLND